MACAAHRPTFRRTPLSCVRRAFGESLPETSGRYVGKLSTVSSLADLMMVLEGNRTSTSRATLSSPGNRRICLSIIFPSPE